ncbi:MAG: hypothetical protein ABUL60_20525 [Myxococcales bacterium]
MNVLIRGLWGLAIAATTSLASAQQADIAAPGAAPEAPAVVVAPSPAGPRTVSLAPQQRENPPEARHWYGWQSLSLDGGVAALSLAALLVGTNDSPHSENLSTALLLGAVVGYGAGGPAIHLIHHRPWQALGSLGLRAGLPVVGGALGLASATCPPPGGGDYGNCGLGELILGAAAGTVLAIALDDSILAWEKSAGDSSSQARLGLTPVVSSDGRRELRVFGTF